MNSVLIVSEQPISLEFAHTSRIYHIGKVLNNFGLNTIIIPQEEKLNKFLKGDRRIQKYIRKFYLFFSMIYIIKSNKIKYIFSRGFYLGLAGIVLSKVFRIKSIFDFHGYLHEEEIYRGHRYKAHLSKFLEKLCIRYSDLVITQTESNRDVIKYLNANVIVIENGIDLKEFVNLRPRRSILNKYSIPNSKPLVGFVGNWEKWMKVEDLLDASNYLSDVSIVIIGRGQNFKGYKNKYKNVFFTERIPHMNAINLMLNFDICVSPYSKDEIMKYKSARKTLEYMAAGKPILVSNVIGKENFLIEKVNCLTYEPENPKDLAEKISILLENANLQMKIGKNNRKLAVNFTWEKNVEKSGLVKILKYHSQ